MRSPAEHPAPFRALERTTRDAALTAHGAAFRAGMFMPDFPSRLPADQDGLVFRARDAVVAIPTLDEVFEADVAAGGNRAPRTIETYRYEMMRHLGDWLSRPLDSMMQRTSGIVSSASQTITAGLPPTG